MPTGFDILARGYFPREFPPPFSTLNFASEVCDGSGNIRAAFIDTIPVSRRFAVLGTHNLVRSGTLRRNLGIAHPVPYAALARFVATNWATILPSATQSPFSLSTPVDTNPERAISAQCNLDTRTERLISLRARASVILKTDVNRFYPSIYTHSLPWAVLGKAAAKAMHMAGTLQGHWSDELDRLTRNINDRQTMGVPIGPDISRLLAEMVLSAVDVALSARHPALRGIRYVDDYEFAVNSRAEAEAVASDLQSILSHFELALNQSKTFIIELPHSFEPIWTSRLRTFFFREAGIRGERNDLTAYFDLAFEFARQSPQENVLKFAIPRLNSVEFAEQNWSCLEEILAQCVVNEPACLPQVCEQLTFYSGLGYQLNSPLWTDVLNRVVADRLPLGQASETVWAMWLMFLYQIPLSAVGETCVANCEDSLAALMGLALREAGLTSGNALDSLNIYAETSEATGAQWLLCYEGGRRGWIVPPSGNSPIGLGAFHYLDHRNVSFLDLAAQPAQPRRHGNFPAAYGGGGGGGGDDYDI